MKNISIQGIALALLMVGLVGWGCNRNVPSPTPFTEAELPGEIQKAFAAAKQPAAKELATEVVNALQAKDYSKAFQAIQTLVAVEGLSKEQANVAARASMTIHTLLQSAGAQGDTKAAQTIKNYRETK